MTFCQVTGSVLVIVLSRQLCQFLRGEYSQRVIGEENSVEMVCLVADSTCKKLRTCQLTSLSVSVGLSDGDGQRSVGDTVFTRNREASLHLLLLSLFLYYFGIYHLIYGAFLYLNDDDTAKYPYLNCRKTAAVGSSHSLCHVVEQSEDPRCDSLDGSARFMKDRIAVLYNIEFCHVFSLIVSAVPDLYRSCRNCISYTEFGLKSTERVTSLPPPCENSLRREENSALERRLSLVFTTILIRYFSLSL